MNRKIMLVDDHPLFMEGLQYLLETHGINVTGLARNGREALVKARILKPEIILMDIKMPEISGLDALKLIKAEMPHIKIVMLTTSEEDDDLFEAIKLGASGYLLKSSNANELVNMLRDLENGEVPLSKGLAPKLLKEFQRMNAEKEQLPQKAEEGRLSERQIEVLVRVAQGMTYKEAGDAIGLTERTVKYHMGRILEILQLENRVQVITYAAKMGIIEK